MDDHVERDMQQYVSARLNSLKDVTKSSSTGKKVDLNPNVYPGLKTHLLQLSGGCFLFLKLTIDLIEHGHLVVKPNTFKARKMKLHSQKNIL